MPSHLFQPGVSGNPKGRAKGSRNKRRDRCSDLVIGWTPALLRKTRELALAGDMAAMALLLDRALPKLRTVAPSYPVPVDPEASTDANRKSVIGALASGDMTIDDGTALLGALKADQSPAAAFGITLVLDGSIRTTNYLPSADVADATLVERPRLPTAEPIPAQRSDEDTR